jgi:phosphate-selective porin OprO/OprP
MLWHIGANNHNRRFTVNARLARLLALYLWALTCMLPLTLLADQDQGLAQLLDVLKENGTISAQQHRQLREALERPRADPATQSSGQVDYFNTPPTPQPQLSTHGGIKVADGDKEASFALTGRLMLDTTLHQEDKHPLGDGTEIRRAAFTLKGDISRDWGYELAMDAASGKARINEAFFQFNGLQPEARLRLGQFKAAFGLEYTTSSKYLTFMERATVNEFTPGYRLGLEGRVHGQHWTGTAELFGEKYDVDPDEEGDEGWGASGRITYSPWHDKDSALHLGASLAHLRLNDRKRFRYAVGPESHLTEIEYLDTGNINEVKYLNAGALELGGVWGPFSLQGEYMRSAARLGDGENLEFDGWYAFATWFVTGESRNYLFEKGAFGRIRPQSRFGAWELALRLSNLDLNDAPISGGEARNLSFGVNWYVNDYLRLMANYIITDHDHFANAHGRVRGDDDPSLFQMRMQVDF